MRIDWSYDGRELLTCGGGTLRRHTLDGASTIVDGPDVLDARWRGDGSIIAIDRYNTIRTHRDGAMLESPREYQLVLTNAWIAESEWYLGMNVGQLFVASFDGRPRWRLDAYKHEVGQMEDRTSAAISDDGKLVAIGYETRAYANYSWQRKEGRGWAVVQTYEDKVLDRSWHATKRAPSAPQHLAFDASGRRLVFATPESGPAAGAIRIDRDDKYPRDHLGGARAAALDRKGILAVYAYPKTIEAAQRRLRVDYLEPGAKGPSKIAVVETLWIDPDLEDIVALAFDRTSRRIACLDASGAIDVVPVP
ncbi:MAG: hypothetical protein M4D80_17585 [Myxococcota bacterium]|nr:hypothetical protein [Deltaproteobacteria bacterium]MDQ3336977.1 hypothetical protein [Myxococcota bacterium]